MTTARSNSLGNKIARIASYKKLIFLTFIVAFILSGASSFVRAEEAGYKCSVYEGGTELATTYGFPEPFYIQPTFSECYSSEGEIIDVKPGGFYLSAFLLDSIMYLPVAFVLTLYIRNVNRRRASSSFMRLSIELLGVYFALVLVAGFAWSGRSAEPNCTSLSPSPYKLEHMYGFPVTFLDRQNVYVLCTWAAKKENPKNLYIINRKALFIDLATGALGAGLVVLAAKKLAKPAKRSSVAR